MLLGVLAIPFAGFRARGQPLVPVALGAYAGLLVHFAYDWDWQLPGVSSPGCSAGWPRSSPDESGAGQWCSAHRARAILLGAAGVCAAFTVVALVGNIAVSRAQSAVNDGRYGKAESNARRATEWAPWSARSWVLLGQAQAGLSRDPEAVDSLRRAVASDPTNYRYWLGLAAVAQGRERVRALQEAFRLNPRFNTRP